MRNGISRASSRPLVSIVTIVRNGSSSLIRAAESVLSQDYPEIEYIIVDGGSTDSTLDIIHDLEKHIAVWVSEPDRGISDAFNKGIALARGEIVGLLNCDDWYTPGAIDTVARAFSDRTADIVYGFIQYWTEERKPSFLVESNHHFLNTGMTVGHPTVFVRRTLYERIGLFRTDFRLAMDYEWLLRASNAGAAFVGVPEILANMQDGGIGDRRWVASLREVARARALHVHGASGRLRQSLFFLNRFSLGCIRRCIDTLGLGILRRIYHRLFSPLRIQ